MHKSHVVRKAFASELAENQAKAAEAAPASPPDRQKPSPMCISSNLKEMSLNKRKRLYDIDSTNASDEKSVWQYAEDIYMHFLEVEVQDCRRALAAPFQLTNYDVVCARYRNIECRMPTTWTDKTISTAK